MRAHAGPILAIFRWATGFLPFFGVVGPERAHDDNVVKEYKLSV